MNQYNFYRIQTRIKGQRIRIKMLISCFDTLALHCADTNAKQAEAGSALQPGLHQNSQGKTLSFIY
jgi:hypothetical protein